MRALSLAAVIIGIVTCACSSTASNATSGNAYQCDDRQFVSDQGGFAQGSVTGDQFVDVCGRVTSVYRARATRSGQHGYFYVAVPGSTSAIEIVSNLDAMAEAPSGDPPAWPWVAPGDYVFVQGRYYYDSSYSQGIDWTEDDESRSWPHAGYVVVCDAARQNCRLYQ